jgi:hypothetical protein
MSDYQTEPLVPGQFRHDTTVTPSNASPRPSRMRTWMPAGVVALVAGIGLALAGAEAVHAANVATDAHNQVTKLSASNRSLAAQVKTLQGGSSGSGVAALNTEVGQIQTDLSTLTQKTGSLSSRVNKICNTQAVSNEESNLNGEMTGSGASFDSQYYSDLQNIISALCQS